MFALMTAHDCIADLLRSDVRTPGASSNCAVFPFHRRSSVVVRPSVERRSSGNNSAESLATRLEASPSFGNVRGSSLLSDISSRP